MAALSTGPASTTCAETIAGSAASRTRAIIGKCARAYFMQAVRRSRRGHPAPARRRKKGRPDMRAAHGRRSEAQRESQLAIARPLQETLLAEVRVTVADAGLQFLIDPYRFLPVEHVVDRKLGLKIRPAEGTLVARSEEHTSEIQSLMRISYAVFFLKKKK